MVKNTGIIICVIAVVAGAAYLKNRDRADSPNAADGKLPRFVELGAGKCTACKKMKPIIEELQKTYAGQLQVDSIDVIDQADAAKPFNWKLIPCQVFLAADGKELWRHGGFISRADLLAKWSELGFTFNDSKETSASQPTTKPSEMP